MKLILFTKYVIYDYTKEGDNMREIVNPLYSKEQIKTQKKPMIATARMENATPGICPKCKHPMDVSRLSNRQEVYFCTTCRVASPLPQY